MFLVREQRTGRLTMNKPTALKPHDVCVVLQLSLSPDFNYRDLAENVGLSLSAAHNSVRRIELARLYSKFSHGVHMQGLLEFLTKGVPYVFPGEIGPEVQGIPTAYSAPPLDEHISFGSHVVWPSKDGTIRGQSLPPLCKAAPNFPRTNPDLYKLLTLIDALRIGRARDRSIAAGLLEQELHRLNPESL
jgi:hypothetical protein